MRAPPARAATPVTCGDCITRDTRKCDRRHLSGAGRAARGRVVSGAAKQYKRAMISRALRRALPLAALPLLLLPADGRPAAAAGPERAAATGDPPAIELNWIGHWLGEDRREDLVREVKREYEFLHPALKINLVFNKELPGPDPDHKRRSAAAIVEMIRSGRVDWDIVFLDVAVYEFVTEALHDPAWTAKHLVDFSGVPGFLESQERFVAAEPRYKALMGGVFTGPFIENYLLNLWYNTEVARRAGIAVKERGMTFEDFLGYAEQLQRHNRQTGSRIAFLKLSSWNRIEALYKSLFDDFPSAVEPVHSERKGRAFRETLEAFERLARFQPLVNEGWAQLPSNDFVSQFLLDDDALFIVGGSFMYSQFRGLSPERCEKVRPVENPYLRRPNGLVGDYTPVFAVMKSSRNRDAAVDFLMSWTKPKNANKWVRYTKNLTGNRSFLSDAEAVDAGAFADVYERFIFDMKRSHGRVPTLNLRAPTYVFGERNPVTVVELRERLAAILEGRTTARAYYEDVMRRFRASAR